MNRTIALLQLLQICGRIDGRKKLQKIVHILREAGHPFSYRYGYHFHGPFSAELKSEIDALVEEQLIDEVPGETISGEFRQYTYLIRESASDLLNDLSKKHMNESWATLARELNSKSAQELESISTVIYLIRSEGAEATLRERFRSLKPHLIGQFECAFHFARRVTNLSDRSAQTM